MAKELFQLDDPGEASREQLQMAKAAARVMLMDMAGNIGRLWKKLGPGVLVVMGNHKSMWSTADHIESQRQLALRSGDEAMAETFASVLRRLDRINPESDVLMAFASSKGLKVLQMPIDCPSQRLEEFIEHWNTLA